MLKLVLGLFGLLGSLLLLDHGEGIFGLLNLNVLTVGLCSLVFDLALLLVIRRIYSLGDPIISNRLLPRLSLVNSTDAETFLIRLPSVECFLVIIVQNMH